MKGQWLTLQADPNNQYDSQAIKVLYNGQYIGWLPLNGGNVKSMIFERLVHGLDVPARFEHTTSIQIGGWDLDENDPKLSDYAVSTRFPAADIKSKITAALTNFKMLTFF